MSKKYPFEYSEEDYDPEFDRIEYLMISFYRNLSSEEIILDDINLDDIKNMAIFNYKKRFPSAKTNTFEEEKINRLAVNHIIFSTNNKYKSLIQKYAKENHVPCKLIRDTFNTHILPIIKIKYPELNLYYFS